MTLSVIRHKIDQIDADLIKTLAGFFAWLQDFTPEPPPESKPENGFMVYGLTDDGDDYPDLEIEFRIIFWTLIQNLADRRHLPLRQLYRHPEFATWQKRLMDLLSQRLSLALEVEASKREKNEPIFNRKREVHVISMAMAYAGLPDLRFSLPHNFITAIMMSIINHCTKIELAQREAG